MFHQGVISLGDMKNNLLTYLTRLVVNNGVSGCICTEGGVSIKLVREVPLLQQKCMPMQCVIGGCPCETTTPDPHSVPFSSAASHTAR